MRFFTSLIVLVPLIFSVVALPASTQNISAIESDLAALVEQLETIVDDLQNPISTGTAQQVGGALNESLPLLTELESDVKDSSSFGQADASTILEYLEKLLSLLIQLGEGLTNAGFDPASKANLAPTVKIFVGESQEAVSATLQGLYGAGLGYGNLVSIFGLALNNALAAIGVYGNASVDRL